MYDRRVGNRELTFGISGQLYRQNVLLYDRQTESLWSQIKKKAVTGPLTGSPLKTLTSVETTWQDWKSRHPDTLVLSDRTGYDRDYQRNPYAGWALGDKVIAIEVAGEIKAYPFAELKKAGNEVTDLVGGKQITIRYKRWGDTAEAFDASGRLLPSMIAAREVWLQFYPKSTLFRRDRPK